MPKIIAKMPAPRLDQVEIEEVVVSLEFCFRATGVITKSSIAI
jgi:hypothetical protein